MSDCRVVPRSTMARSLFYVSNDIQHYPLESCWLMTRELIPFQNP